jgi:hypothetical protein
MSKILRKTAYLFAVNAGAAGIEEFASKETTGSLVYSVNPAAIQTAAWMLGWTAAQYQGVFAPYYQDRNAVDFVASYQIAYLLQQGIPEWDSATTYYTNSIVQSGGNIYFSAIDGNINNMPPLNASNSYWTLSVLSTQRTNGPTRTVLASGSGMYNPPSKCVRIFVRMIGGGGGGGGTNLTSAGGNGGAGGNTSFGGATAFGGFGGISANPNTSIVGGGIGGAASGGSVNIPGATGLPCMPIDTDQPQGCGGSSKFGGAGVNRQINMSANASPNSGSGGSGTVPLYPSYYMGSGGGAGGYVEMIVQNPSPTSYAVGDGGYGGSSSGSVTGGTGGSGVIIIDEYYY